MCKNLSASTKDVGQDGNSRSVVDESQTTPVFSAGHTWVNTSAPTQRRSNNLPDITYHGYPNMDIKFSGALPLQSPTTGELSINRYYQINEKYSSLFDSEDDLRNTDLIQFCGTGNDTKEQRARIKMALKFSTAAGRIAVFAKSVSGHHFQNSGSGFWIAERYFITAAHVVNLLDPQQVRDLYKRSKPHNGGMSAWVSTRPRVDEQLGNEDYQVFLVDISDEDDIALFKIVDGNDLPPYTLAHHDLEPADISTNTPIFTIAYPDYDRDLSNDELAKMTANEPTIVPLISKIQQMKGRVGRVELLYERYLMTESDAQRREWIKQNFREFEKAFPDNRKSLCTGVSMAKTQAAKPNSVLIDMHMSAFYQCSGGMVCYLRKTTKGFVPKVIGIVGSPRHQYCRPSPKQLHWFYQPGRFVVAEAINMNSWSSHPAMNRDNVWKTLGGVIIETMLGRLLETLS